METTLKINQYLMKNINERHWCEWPRISLILILVYTALGEDRQTSLRIAREQVIATRVDVGCCPEWRKIKQ